MRFAIGLALLVLAGSLFLTFAPLWLLCAIIERMERRCSS